MFVLRKYKMFVHFIKSRKLLISITLALGCLLLLLDSFRTCRNFSRPRFNPQVDTVNKVVIGTVSCRKGNDSKPNEEVAVLMKSVLISAMLNSIKIVEFHLFLEYHEDETFFSRKIEEYGFPGTVQLFFYSAMSTIPRKYHAGMIFKRKLFRCTFVRLFFEKALPKNVDAIIYMDTDFIITGNVGTLWQELLTMNSEQLIGVVPNHKPEKRVRYNTYNCFGLKPHVPPLGLNAGLAVMNLTKMRKYKFTERMLRLYDIYSQFHDLEDQVLLNMMTYHDPGILKILPCVHNIRCSTCEQWFVCQDAYKYGIQSVHGAAGQFERGGRFHYIYQKYLQFNMKTGDIQKDLILPLITMREPYIQALQGQVFKCATKINKLLFKNLSQVIKNLR